MLVKFDDIYITIHEQSTDLSPTSDIWVFFSQSASTFKHTSLDRLAGCPSTLVNKSCNNEVLWGCADQTDCLNTCNVVYVACLSGRSDVACLSVWSYMAPGERGCVEQPQTICFRSVHHKQCQTSISNSFLSKTSRNTRYMSDKHAQLICHEQPLHVRQAHTCQSCHRNPWRAIPIQS